MKTIKDSDEYSVWYYYQYNADILHGIHTYHSDFSKEFGYYYQDIRKGFTLDNIKK